MSVSVNKRRIPVTLDADVSKMISDLVGTKVYFNRSHAIEMAVRGLHKAVFNGSMKKDGVR